MHSRNQNRTRFVRISQYCKGVTYVKNVQLHQLTRSMVYIGYKRRRSYTFLRRGSCLFIVLGRYGPR
jgi:hypothetical protein